MYAESQHSTYFSLDTKVSQSWGSVLCSARLLDGCHHSSFSLLICPAPYCQAYLLYNYVLIMQFLSVHSLLHPADVQQVFILCQTLGYQKQVTTVPSPLPSKETAARASGPIPSAGIGPHSPFPFRPRLNSSHLSGSSVI